MATLVVPLPITSRIANHMTDARQQSVSADIPKLQPIVAPTGKPKLSLQTASLTGAYGSLSRSIAPNTAQTIYTPTTTNTLSNQWDLSIRPSPISRTESPRPVPSKQYLPYVLTLPFGVRSILKNSPLPRQASVSASPRDSKRKVFFPQPKKVSFKSNLEDAIETKEYVARHADLSSSDDELSSEGTTSSSQNNSEDEVTEYSSPTPSRKRKIRRETLTTTEYPTQDQAPQSETNQDNNSSKTTHSCKRRKWQWTLPTPVQPPSENPESTSNTDVQSSLESSNSETHTTSDSAVIEQEQDHSDLDSCKACSDPSTDQDLGGPPDTLNPESESMGTTMTCQEYDDKNR